MNFIFFLPFVIFPPKTKGKSLNFLYMLNPIKSKPKRNGRNSRGIGEMLRWNVSVEDAGLDDISPVVPRTPDAMASCTYEALAGASH